MTMHNRGFRPGLSLIEVLVVIGIIAILIGLLLPAVQRVRGAAQRLKSINNMKQLMLATHMHVDDHGGLFPDRWGTTDGSGYGRSIHVTLLPYIEQGAIYNAYAAKLSIGDSNYFIPLFYSPADPTIAQTRYVGATSYAANGVLFSGYVRREGVTDGTSNTIAWAEHYAYGCNGVAFIWVLMAISYYDFPPTQNQGIETRRMRRATFADNDLDDVVPGNPVPNETFQVRPSLADCNPRIAQTPHASGMLCALADGSVRSLNPGISPAMYWAAVTPAGGEVLGNDW